MAKAYHIVQWSLKYEKSDTRKTDYMPWFAKQTKLTGLGIGRVMREPYPRNMELFGIWTVLETLASQSVMKDRGWLVRDGRPLEFDEMSSLLPTVPPEAFKKACDWFVENVPGWLECVDFPPANLPANSHERNTTGRSLGDSPANLPANSSHRGNGGGNSATDRQTDSTQTDIHKKRERENKGGLSVQDREGQGRQFAAVGARIEELQRIPEEERTDEQSDELKKMRDLRKKIQKKQARGDFSLVEVAA